VPLPTGHRFTLTVPEGAGFCLKGEPTTREALPQPTPLRAVGRLRPDPQAGVSLEALPLEGEV